MKKTIYSTILFFMYWSIQAQVGINTVAPNALLEVQSSNQATPATTDGILIPKVDDFPSANPSTNQDGMMVFATGNGAPTKGFYYWNDNSNSWSALGPAPSMGLEQITEATNTGWRLAGSNPLNFGNIGFKAVDASISNNTSSSFGATGNYSFSGGLENTSSGQYSFTMGVGNLASSYGAVSMGRNSTSEGNYAISLGDYAYAAGNTAVALGNHAISMGDFALATGYWNLSSTYGETTLGLFSTLNSGSPTSWVATDRLFTIGNGTDNMNRSDALTIFKNGTITAPSLDIAEITDNKALLTKEYADVTYQNLSLAGLEKIDEGNGYGWRLVGSNPANYGPIGYNAVDLSANTLPATGGANGEYSFATGRSTTASGNYSFASGYTSVASGDYSISSGYGNVASGNWSTAIGNDNNSTQSASVAIGVSNDAAGVNATAIGVGNTASGYAAIAIGRNNIAPSFFETKMGVFSTTVSGNTSSWVPTDRLFTIGNGTNSSSRSDALEILKNGAITAPSFDIAEITDDKALITKEFADATYAAGTVENPQTPTFILNWEAYGGGYIDPSFYKNNGRVYLQGLLRKTVAFVAGELIFTLPIGYRPSGRVLATGGQSGNTVRVDILSNGEVRYMSGGNGSDFISLEGISFRIL